MPYGAIALIAALVATGWFVAATGASRLSKGMVLALCLASLVMGYVVPRWWLAGLLVQVVLVIGISLYAKARPLAFRSDAQRNATRVARESSGGCRRPPPPGTPAGRSPPRDS